MTARKDPNLPALKTGPARSNSLTAAQFAAVAPFVPINADRLEAARLVLVDDLSYEAATQKIGLGWKRQSVGDCVRAVWRTYLKYQESLASASPMAHVPDGWEQVTLVAPKELIPQFYQLIAAFSTGKPVSQASQRKSAAKKPAAKKQA